MQTIVSLNNVCNKKANYLSKMIGLSESYAYPVIRRSSQ